jgi:hypothetical protein
MSCRRLLMAGLGCAVLAGCNTVNKNIGSEDPFLGEAVKYNAAVQTINPDPVYPEGSAEPGGSGVKGAAAVKRYRTDEVNARHQREVSASNQGTLSTTAGPR